jgi:tetratricopeptide (TPR) repeat protein
LVVGGLEDGFVEDVLPYARHLETTDSDPVRGAVVYGAALLQLKRFAQARDVLEGARARVGEVGYLETNIAKAYAGLGEQAQAEQILWHALELDPNQDNALGWYVAIQVERFGESGGRGAYARVAELPGSWRAQIWLARSALAAKDIETARTLYEEVLTKLKEIPADVLMQISGDLGNAGQLTLMVSLCRPRFSVQQHGLQVGNNLIKGYVDIGRTAEAREILEMLYSQQRPDWQETLVYWEKEIDKTEGRFGPVKAEESLQIELVTIPEPLWTRSRLGFEALLPGKNPDARHLVVLCGTGEKEVPKDATVYSQPADELGRVTRGLPLLIAEELFLRTSARVTYVLPWIKEGGFVLFGQPLDPSEKWIKDLDAAWLLTTHVDAKQEPWQIQLRAVDGKSGEQIREWLFPIRIHEGADKVLVDCVESVLKEFAPTPNALFSRPRTDWLPHYLVMLEQGLSVGMSNMTQDGKRFLQSERSIIDGLLRAAVELPTNVRVRMLLLSTLERESRNRPEVVREYRDKLLLLEKEHPIADPKAAGAITRAVESLTSDVFH